MFDLLLCLFAIVLARGIWLFFLEPIVEAWKYANNFRPVNRPENFYLDTKENKWCSEPISDRTLWWRCFWDHIDRG